MLSSGWPYILGITVKQLSKELKRALGALALSNAGEYLSQQEKESRLGAGSRTGGRSKKPARLLSAATPHQPRQVALAVGSQLPESVLQYALHTCHQIGAQLVVLCTSEGESALAPHLGAIQAARIPYRMVTLDNPDKGELGRFLQDHANLQFVIAWAGEACREIPLHPEGRWELPIPLVMVSAQPMPVSVPAV